MPAMSTPWRIARECLQLVIGYIGHNFALLALPVALAGRHGAGVAARRWRALAACLGSWSQSRRQRSQALNVWIIQIVVAIGPPLGALAFIDLHEDRLGNLAVLPGAAGAGRDPGAAVPKIALFDLHGGLARDHARRRCAASPYIAAREMADNPNSYGRLRRALANSRAN